MNKPSEPGSRKHLDGIEALRGFAAMAILIFHLVWVGQVKLPSTIDFLKYYLGNGVPLFFVISAFSLGYGYLGRLNNAKSLTAFYLRRLFRIAPLFYFMFAVQLIELKYVYDMVRPVRDIIINMTFLFNFSPRLVDGIVPASWSIGIEMIFYFILPGYLILARGYLGAVLCLVLSIILATEWSATVLSIKDVNSSFAAHGFVIGMPYFCFGVLALHVFRSMTSGSLASNGQAIAYAMYGVSLVLLAALISNHTLLAGFAEHGVNVVQSSLWGLPFGLLVLAVAIHPIFILVNRLTLFWGRISYSLYLTHPGIVYFLQKMGLYDAIHRACQGIPTFSFLVSAVFTIVVISAVSWLTFKFIEAPGMALGRKLANGISSGIDKIPAALTPALELSAVPVAATTNARTASASDSRS